jgi:hypothetical protein
MIQAPGLTFSSKASLNGAPLDYAAASLANVKLDWDTLSLFCPERQ